MCLSLAGRLNSWTTREVPFPAIFMMNPWSFLWLCPPQAEALWSGFSPGLTDPGKKVLWISL